MRASELFQAYRRGWRDAAASSLPDTRFTAHPTREDLTAEYRRGYTEGRASYTADMNAAMKRLGYVPTLLRDSEASA